jgi:hypothetical protein
MDYKAYTQLMGDLQRRNNVLVVNGHEVLRLDDTVQTLDLTSFTGKSDHESLMWGSINIFSVFGDEVSRPVRTPNAIALAREMLGHRDGDENFASEHSDDGDKIAPDRSASAEGVHNISGDEEICLMLGPPPMNPIFVDEVGLGLFGGTLVFIVVDGNHRTVGLRSLLSTAQGCMLRFKLIKTVSDAARKTRALQINRNRSRTIRDGLLEYFYFVAEMLGLQKDGTLEYCLRKPNRIIAENLIAAYGTFSAEQAGTAFKFIIGVLHLAGYMQLRNGVSCPSSVF